MQQTSKKKLVSLTYLKKKLIHFQNISSETRIQSQILNACFPFRMRVYQRCSDSDFLESGSNPVLQILNPNPIRIRHQLPFKQSDSCLNPDKYVATKQTATFFSVNTKPNSNPDPATGKKTSLLILLEAAGVRIQKIQNPVHAHLWCLPIFLQKTKAKTNSTERVFYENEPNKDLRKIFIFYFCSCL